MGFLFKTDCEGSYVGVNIPSASYRLIEIDFAIRTFIGGREKRELGPANVYLWRAASSGWGADIYALIDQRVVLAIIHLNVHDTAKLAGLLLLLQGSVVNRVNLV